MAQSQTQLQGRAAAPVPVQVSWSYLYASEIVPCQLKGYRQERDPFLIRRGCVARKT